MDMNTGFLFFDNDPKKTLQQKVQSAQSDFSQKFVHKAEYCLVNTGDALGVNLEEIGKACGLIVQAYKFVMPHNLWVGFEGMDVRERV
jgi:hypothetical protein